MTIERLRELEQAATPGPWQSHVDSRRALSVLDGSSIPYRVAAIPKRDYWPLDGAGEANAALIAAMRNALPALLAAADALRLIVNETYFPHHTPSSESGPEEWDIEVGTASILTLEQGVAALAAGEAVV